jgi:predicted membrane-bound spermidine synthase
LATTTEQHIVQSITVPSAIPRTRASGLVLMALVFIGGASVMTVEMSASRLLAPYFGTSLFIWANLIGLVMVYLALGYWLGGRLADRYPRPSVLYGITAIAGFTVAIIPALSRPILSWSLQAFDDRSVSVFYGSLLGVILLFSAPLLLLGFVSPFAIRLRTIGVASAGGTAGSVSALSTLGSILGTFVSVFLLIPRIGTAATLYSAAIALLVFSVLGLVSVSSMRTAAVHTALLALAMGLAIFAPRGFIKEPANGSLLYERESAYNYIQVVQEEYVDPDTQQAQKTGRVLLALNEGHATHSIYNPNQVLTGGPWDYWSVAPYFSKDFRPSDMKGMAMIGSAAGTAGQILTQIYGPLPVDGVEIDPEIVDAGNRFFHLDDYPNLVTHVQDGRTFLQTDGKDKKWTVVGIDAYRQPYIPFHFTTKEFFEEVRTHLTPDGAVMINAGRTATDTRLVDALANTMLQVYPNVYVIDVPTMANSMVVGTNSPTRLENFRDNASRAAHPLLKQIFDASLQKGNVREVKPDAAGIVFTDDKAPVEEVIDQIIFNVVSETAK